MNNGEYYLHTNGDVIFKPHGIGDYDSTFIRKWWHLSQISKTPEIFTDWLAELNKLGANKARIEFIANHNNLHKHVPDWRERVFDNV